MTHRVFDSIKDNEGFSPVPYIDPLAKQNIPKDELAIIEKYWDKLNITIGYGTCLQTRTFREHEANSFINHDVNEDFIVLKKELDYFKALPHHVQDVLLEMSYQMGISGLLKFKKTLRYIETNDYHSASIEMLDSLWARQTPGRAKKLSNLMKEGY